MNTYLVYTNTTTGAAIVRANNESEAIEEVTILLDTIGAYKPKTFKVFLLGDKGVIYNCLCGG